MLAQRLRLFLVPSDLAQNIQPKLGIDKTVTVSRQNIMMAYATKVVLGGRRHTEASEAGGTWTIAHDSSGRVFWYAPDWFHH